MPRVKWHRWIFACVAGPLAGFVLLCGTILALSIALGEPHTLPRKLVSILAMAVSAAFAGAALGFLQASALRPVLTRLRTTGWLGVTAAPAFFIGGIGMALALFVKMPTPEMFELDVVPLPRMLLSPALFGAGIGLMLSLPQWLVLRRHAENTAAFIPLHIIAWALLVSAGAVGVALVPGTIPRIVGALGGALNGSIVLGIVTGVHATQLRPWVEEFQQPLRGKLAVVSGANAGIGYEIAIGLSRLGASVVLLCRDEIRGAAAASAIRVQVPGSDVRAIVCDLGRFESVRAAAARLNNELPRLDVLVHNAGASFEKWTRSADGLESTLAVNVVGPFLLTALLREKLENSDGRVISLASIEHRGAQLDLEDLQFVRREYDGRRANQQAQRGRVLLTAELGRRAPRLRAVSVHPGAVLTRAHEASPSFWQGLFSSLSRPNSMRVELAAIPVLRLAVLPAAKLPTGRFFDRYVLDGEVPDTSFSQAFFSACEKLTSKPAGDAEQPQ